MQARTTLRTGDMPRGINLAVSSGNAALQKECAAILEGMRQWQDAASKFYNLQSERAVSIAGMYIRSRQQLYVSFHHSVIPRACSQSHCQGASHDSETACLCVLCAVLYEQASAFEKAAEIYINQKNFAQAAPLMNSISTPKLHLLFAQAKEAEGAFVEACAAYEKARDLDAVVRLNLEQMRNPQRAMQIVRETRST